MKLGAGSYNAADRHPAAPEGVTDPELRKAYIGARGVGRGALGVPGLPACAPGPSRYPIASDK